MRDATTRSSRGEGPWLPGVSPVDAAAQSWVMRIEAGLTIAEEVEFAEWLSADARHEASFRRYQAAWDRFAPLAATVARDAIPNPDRFASAQTAGVGSGSSQPPNPAPQPAPILYRWVAPGVGLAAAIALLLLLPVERREPPVAAPLALPSLCQERTLSDGSVVQLNRGAEVTVNFTAGERRVRLERGEASFTVARNPARPFVVAAGAIEVRAVGTAFNVRLAPVAIEVVVTEGTVQLGDSPKRHQGTNFAAGADGHAVADSRPVATMVTKGQQACVSLATSAPVPLITELTAAEMEARLAWRPRRLNFDDAPLAVIVGEFNRSNPVRLVVSDPVVANRRMTATFRSDNLEGFVRLLESNIGVRAERLSDTEVALVRR